MVAAPVAASSPLTVTADMPAAVPAGHNWAFDGVTAAPGTYAFHCLIHPGMSGLLTVLPSGSAGTTAVQLAKAVHDQVKSHVKAGFAAEEKVENSSHVKNANGTTTWYMTAGTGSPDGHVAVLEFLPLVLGVHPGDTVVWRPQSVNEPHTVTFPGEQNSDMLPLCEGKGGDTPAVPKEIPPNGPFDFSCGSQPFPDEVEFGGGNGVRNLTIPGQISDSGLFATRSERHALGLPQGSFFSRWSVSFVGATPGTYTYTYICQVHAGMVGTITVH